MGYKAMRGRTFRGTMKAMASIELAATFKPRAISQSDTLRPRRGRKHMPRWGSEDLYSVSRKRLSFSYS